jgi:hypothetical protein
VEAFRRWFTVFLSGTEFQCATVGVAIDGAVESLGISREEARRFLVQVTRPGSTFLSDGDILTIKDD